MRKGCRHLHHRRAHAPRASVDEERLAGLQPGELHQPQPGSNAHQGNGRRLFIADRIRNRVQPGLIDGRVFGKRALAAEQSLVTGPDARAGRKPSAGGPAFDNSSQIAADDKRRWQLHLHISAADIGIDRIDGHGSHANQHLRARGLWLREVSVHDCFRRPRLLDVGGFHFQSTLLLKMVREQALIMDLPPTERQAARIVWLALVQSTAPGAAGVSGRSTVMRVPRPGAVSISA